MSNKRLITDIPAKCNLSETTIKKIKEIDKLVDSMGLIHEYISFDEDG